MCETGTEKEHFDFIKLLSLPLAIPKYKILLACKLRRNVSKNLR